VSRIINRLIEGVDERTALPTLWRNFLSEEIPASSGWHQVFGSVALFLFLLQFFTGAMLAINYAATPVDAYDSLRYILMDVTAGRLMRGLHHWGSSMIVVTVVLHMTQVFLWASYKRPREGTWITGLILLLFTMAYGLTGYLLPWDNRAYWGTVVTTQMLATTPIVGSYISRLMASTGQVGVLTFTRFYVLHILLLPAGTVLLIVLHVVLVRRHGVAPAPGDEFKERKSFYPEQVFKDTVALFIAFAILFTMTVAIRAPLEHIADPNNTAYVPRPEWYFLFLFELLKWFKGPLEVFGTVLLPLVAILLLVLTPFIDRGKMACAQQRITAIGIVLLSGLGWAALTVAAVKASPPQSAMSAVDFSLSTDWMNLRPAQTAGVQYFRTARCAACHATANGNLTADSRFLNSSQRRHDTIWLSKHIHVSSQDDGNGLTNIQVRDLIALFQQITPDNAEILNTTPPAAAAGAALFQDSHCGACHSINGAGGAVGPPLNGVAQRRTELWVIEHFDNPRGRSPNTSMPTYKFSPMDKGHMVFYLFTLPDKPDEKH
jgi:ubiquinol-cytochrome c reductase cytochrome b subunit